MHLLTVLSSLQSVLSLFLSLNVVVVVVCLLNRVESGRKDVKYCYDELELKQYLGTLGDSTPKNLQRFKGLGEMMPQQLWETTLDPKTRTLRRLTVDDAAMVNHTFSLLMSDKVGPRRQFIEDEGPEFELGADDDDDDDDVHDPNPPPDAEGLEGLEDEEPGPLLPWFCCC